MFNIYIKGYEIYSQNKRIYVIKLQYIVKLIFFYRFTIKENALLQDSIE